MPDVSIPGGGIHGGAKASRRGDGEWLGGPDPFPGLRGLPEAARLYGSTRVDITDIILSMYRGRGRGSPPSHCPALFDALLSLSLCLIIMIVQGLARHDSRGTASRTDPSCSFRCFRVEVSLDVAVHDVWIMDVHSIAQSLDG